LVVDRAKEKEASLLPQEAFRVVKARRNGAEPWSREDDGSPALPRRRAHSWVSGRPGKPSEAPTRRGGRSKNCAAEGRTPGPAKRPRCRPKGSSPAWARDRRDICAACWGKCARPASRKRGRLRDRVAAASIIRRESREPEEELGAASATGGASSWKRGLSDTGGCCRSSLKRETAKRSASSSSQRRCRLRKNAAKRCKSGFEHKGLRARPLRRKKEGGSWHIGGSRGRAHNNKRMRGEAASPTRKTPGCAMTAIRRLRFPRRKTKTWCSKRKGGRASGRSKKKRLLASNKKAFYESSPALYRKKKGAMPTGTRRHSRTENDGIQLRGRNPAGSARRLAQRKRRLRVRPAKKPAPSSEKGCRQAPASNGPDPAGEGGVLALQGKKSPRPTKKKDAAAREMKVVTFEGEAFSNRVPGKEMLSEEGSRSSREKSPMSRARRKKTAVGRFPRCFEKAATTRNAHNHDRLFDATDAPPRGPKEGSATWPSAKAAGRSRRIEKGRARTPDESATDEGVIASGKERRLEQLLRYEGKYRELGFEERARLQGQVPRGRRRGPHRGRRN